MHMLSLLGVAQFGSREATSANCHGRKSMALDLRVSWIAVRRKPSGKDSVELSNDRTACAVPLNRVALGVSPWKRVDIAAPEYPIRCQPSAYAEGYLLSLRRSSKSATSKIANECMTLSHLEFMHSLALRAGMRDREVVSRLPLTEGDHLDVPLARKSDPVEEFQGAHGLIELGPALLLSDQVNLPTADVFGSQMLGRLSTKCCKSGYMTDVGLDGLG